MEVKNSPVMVTSQCIWKHVLVVMVRVNYCAVRPVPWFIILSVPTHLSGVFPEVAGHVRFVVGLIRIFPQDVGSRKLLLKVSY